MRAQSVFNPFSANKPLKRFGSLHVNSGGLEFNKLPYVGPVFDYKDDDPQEMQPQLQYNGCAAQLDLSKKADMDQYRALVQKVCNGTAIISVEERVYDQEIKSWRVFLRWMEPFYGPPDAVKQAVAEQATNGSHTQPTVVLPETNTSTPRDLADVVAEAHNEKQVPPYATIDEVIHSLREDSQ